jgi:hypothetical protein
MPAAMKQRPQLIDEFGQRDLASPTPGTRAIREPYVRIIRRKREDLGLCGRSPAKLRGRTARAISLVSTTSTQVSSRARSTMGHVKRAVRRIPMPYVR